MSSCDCNKDASIRESDVRLLVFHVKDCITTVQALHLPDYHADARHQVVRLRMRNFSQTLTLKATQVFTMQVTDRSLQGLLLDLSS